MVFVRSNRIVPDSGARVTVYVPQAGGEHGSQSGGPYVCNGTTYMLPADSW